MSAPVFAGYAALFAVIFLGESGLPLFVPAELMLFAAGSAAANQVASLTDAFGLALAADVLGGLCLFALVRLARGRSGRLGRFGRPVERAAERAGRLGGRSALRIGLARCVPFVRVPSTLAAGLTGLPTAAFAAALLVGGVVWVSVFLGGGFFLARTAFHL